jgi:hypothetical protein
MTDLLEVLVADERGEEVFREWMRPRAIDIACKAVSTQMDAMVKVLSTASSITRLTPKFLRTWSLKNNIAQPADTVASDVVKILASALNTERALANNKKKHSDTVRSLKCSHESAKLESLRKSRMRLLGAQTHCMRLFIFFALVVRGCYWTLLVMLRSKKKYSSACGFCASSLL